MSFYHLASVDKRRLSDWFGPKYNCKVSSYMGSTKVPLRSRLNLGLKLNYFIVRFVHLELFFFILQESKN